MIFKKYFSQSIAVSFAFLVMGIGTVAAQKIWTLEECINYALANNIQIKQSLLQTQSAEINLLQSKLDFAPSANMSSNVNYNWGRNVDPVTNVYSNNESMNNSYNFNGRVDLFKGLQKWNTLRKNEVDYMASQYYSEEIINNISLSLTAAYLNILFNHEMLLVAQNQVEVTRMQIDRTSKLVEAGTLPRGDLLEIQSQGATEESNLISAENNLALSYLDLKQLLDLPSDNKLDIDHPEISVEQEVKIIPSEQIYSNAVEIMPEIKGGEMNLQSAEQSVKIAKGALYPSLSLSGGIGTNYNSTQHRVVLDDTSPIMSFMDQMKNNRGEYVTLSLNIPIFNGYAARSQVKLAEINTVNKSFELQLKKNELRKSIEQKYHDAIAAYKIYNASKTSVESLSESFKYTEEKFNVGIVTSVDYSISKIKLTQAQSELLRSKYDYIFKTKILDFYMGIPLSI
jgi:outer membrane protein